MLDVGMSTAKGGGKLVPRQLDDEIVIVHRLRSGNFTRMSDPQQTTSGTKGTICRLPLHCWCVLGALSAYWVGRFKEKRDKAEKDSSAISQHILAYWTKKTTFIRTKGTSSDF